MITIFWKEWRDILRDKKTLMTLIILPLMLTPIIMAVALGVGYLASQKSEAERYTYTWVSEPVVAFDQALQDSEFFKSAADTDSIDVELSGNGTQIEAAFDTGDLQSALGRRLNEVVSDLNDRAAASTLAQFDLTPADIEPWQLSDRDINGASEAENISSTLIGMLLPMLLMISVLITAMSLSADLVAGERERNTLETLLASPIKASDALLAKWMMLSCASIMSAILMMGSLSLFLVPARWFVTGVGEDILAAWSPGLLAMTLLLAVPLSILIAGALLAITRSAASFKEAQSQASLVFIIIYIPIIFAMQGLLEPTLLVLAIPIVNYPVVIQALAAGDMVWWMPILATVSNLLVAAGLGVIYSAKIEADNLLNHD